MWAWESCFPAEVMYSSPSNAREQMLVRLPRAEWPVSILCAVLPAARCVPLFEKVRVVVGDFSFRLIW